MWSTVRDDDHFRQSGRRENVFVVVWSDRVVDREELPLVCGSVGERVDHVQVAASPTSGECLASGHGWVVHVDIGYGGIHHDEQCGG
jgi:hypothetical protein